MRQRKRSTDNRADPTGAGGPAGAGDDLERLRQSGEELVAAADEVIGRALSADSAAFLEANRQSSGQ